MNSNYRRSLFPETTIDTESPIAKEYQKKNKKTTWPSWYCFLESPAVHCVYVTNSIPQNKAIEVEATAFMKHMAGNGKPEVKFKCLDIAPVVTSIIKNTDDPKYDS